MSKKSEDRQAGESKNAAGFCFAVFAFGVALLLASRMGSEVKWLTDKPLFNQPGFWPVMAIGGMVLFGALELLLQFRRKASFGIGAAGPEIRQWFLALEFVGWFLIYVTLVPIIGYLFATVMFCVLLTFRLGYRASRMIGASALVGVATVVIFKSFLAVKIPGGAVYEYLPNAVRNFMIINF